MTDQFLFRESEFEDEGFDAAGFVARYRRVNSLDSLKDQLKQYCEALRQQLYVVINRDYKDFITIATKLDGVDSRVELLRKPLVDLRLDLSLLHDGLLSSRQAIQETMNRKQEVSQRRGHVESALLCLEKLDTVESIVSGKPLQSTNSSGTTASSSSSSANTRTRRDLSAAVSKAKKSGSSHFAVSHTAFDSSELERAGYALANAQACLKRLQQSREGSITSSSSGSSSSSSSGSSSSSSSGSGASLSSSLLALSKTLGQRCETLNSQLLAKIKSRLSDIMTEASSGSETSFVPQDAAGPSSDALRRSLSHCLRALAVLKRGDIAESALSESIMPYLKSTLTLGRVDGSEGRGSYSGLRDALGAVLVVLRRYSLPLAMAEEAREARAGEPDSLDLLVNGIWVPVLTLLLERFPQLFSVGIAATMARCYRALEHFTTSLVDLLEVQGASDSGSVSIVGDAGVEGRRKRALARILSHSKYKELHARWDLRLYAQLRAQEVSARLERACEMCTHGRLTAGAFVATHSYDSSDRPVAVAVPAPGMASGDQSAVSAVTVKPLMHTLSQAELSELRATYGLAGDSFHLPLLLVCAVEAATCLHPTVLLRPLSPELLVLSLRCVSRIEAHVALTLDVSTLAFPKGAASFPDGSGSSASSSSSGASAASAGPHVTPAKPLQATASTPTTGPGTASSSSSATVASPDELVLLCADLHKLSQWLVNSLLPRVLEVFCESGTGTTQASSLTALVQSHSNRLDQCRRAVFSKLTSLLAVECKRHLASVKAIAGKYRMTNKPPPEAASAYVSSVLAPLGSFVAQRGGLITPFAKRGAGGNSLSDGWDVALAEDVASAFLREVQQLLETVKKTDTTLQRRSKIKAAAGAMTDSDKIALQVSLDIKAFGAELAALDISSSLVPSFAQLEEIEVQAGTDEGQVGP